MEEEKEYFVIYEDDLYSSLSMNKLKIAIFTEEEYANKMMEILKKESSNTTYVKDKIKESDLSNGEKFDFIDYYKSNIDKGLNVYVIKVKGLNELQSIDLLQSSINDKSMTNLNYNTLDGSINLVTAESKEEALKLIRIP